MFRRPASLAVALSLCLLTACGGGGGGGSDEAATPAPTPPTGSLPAPGAIQLSGIETAPDQDSDGQFGLSWPAVTGAGFYRVSENGVETRVEVPRLTRSGLPDGTYRYRVTACTDAACGPAGAETSVVVRHPATPGGLALKSTRLVQSHVLPPEGLRFQVTGFGADQNAVDDPQDSQELHLVGARPALFLVEPEVAGGTLSVEGFRGEQSLGRLNLAAPGELPTSEGAGPRFGEAWHSVLLPGSWLTPGLKLVVKRDGAASAAIMPTIGAPARLNLVLQPFYLFGATPADKPLSETAALPAATAREYVQKHPLTELKTTSWPAWTWPDFPMPPTGSLPGFVMHQPSDAAANGRDGFALMGGVLDILHQLRRAHGVDGQDYLAYSPLLLKESGKLVGAGGGLGGGGVATGDAAWAGIFVHELGHAYGLPHAGEAYDSKQYPYERGSLKGSAWGFDADHNEFLDPRLQPGHRNYASCARAGERVLDGSGQCYKQDPMQGGAGDQSTGYAFADFADFNMARVQRWLETRRVRDAAFPGGYKQWDAAKAAYVAADLKRGSSGQGGQVDLDEIALDQPVWTVIGALSVRNATPDLNRIYAPQKTRGGLPRSFDPTLQADMDALKAKYPWYCVSGDGHADGCDFTLRARYADGTVRHVLLPVGYRKFFSNDIAPEASVATSGDSFSYFAVNLPDTGSALQRLDLFETPYGSRPNFTAISPATLGSPVMSWVP